ncbi:MAG: hypothetical protein ACXVRJ_08680 [Gaiellaceae bacterium]
MTLALLPQYEKETMGVIVGLGAIVAGLGPLRSGRFHGRPGWSSRRTRVATSLGIAIGVAIAIASFTVNVEAETYWGSFRDKSILAAWVAVVAVIAVLSVRRARSPDDPG